MSYFDCFLLTLTPSGLKYQKKNNYHSNVKVGNSLWSFYMSVTFSVLHYVFKDVSRANNLKQTQEDRGS